MNNRTYLNCLTREKAQMLWLQRLEREGFFTEFRLERISAAESLGRVTGENVYARRSVPHYNGAAMDGIALRAEETFGAAETNPVTFRILAKDKPYSSGSCYIIDTGDPIPVGTNAVVMIEDVHIKDGKAEIIAAASPWQHVRNIGEDIVAGEMVLPEFHMITPPDIAAMLMAGIGETAVIAKPVVTVIPTGTELVASQEELRPGLILDVNSHMICAAIKNWGASPTRHPIVPDDFAALKQTVAKSLQSSDMVVINAGTSAGTEDFTARVLAELGEVLVHGLAIKPGKPVVLALCQGKPVVGLPGYPVSAMLTAEMFIRDILHKRQRLPLNQPKVIKAKVAKQVYSQIGTEEYIRVALGEVKGKLVAAPLSRGAGLISSLTKAQGLLAIPENADGLAAGTETEVIMLLGRAADNNMLAVGSHDLALDILAVFLRRRFDLPLTCANVGSMGGLLAIRNGEAHVAGIHMLDEQTGEYNIPFVKKILPPDMPWLLVHMAKREQGIIVARGNPKTITGLKDLARSDIVFVNRQRGSGTRMMLDFKLKCLGINPSEIVGYQNEVATHMTVAASIAGGAADAGLGIRAAAEALGLDFIPVAHEQYDLVLSLDPDDKRLSALVQALESPEFKREIESLAGYDFADSGKLLAWSAKGKDERWLLKSDCMLL